MRSEDFPSYGEKSLWVTVVLTPMATDEDALDWCRDHDLWDNARCLDKLLSHTLGPDDHTFEYIPTTVPG